MLGEWADRSSRIFGGEEKGVGGSLRKGDKGCKGKMNGQGGEDNKKGVPCGQESKPEWRESPVGREGVEQARGRECLGNAMGEGEGGTGCSRRYKL